jgi:branched-chain amino acid transport system substrate-binding protein
MLVAMLVAAALTRANSVQAEDKEIVVGLQCDRTGPTQIVGTVLCPGYHDYIALVNSRGGVEGHRIRVVEIDHEYKVPPAMARHKSRR